MKNLKPEENKFHKGASDGKHYWLTPPELYDQLHQEFNFDFDPCPFPKPEEFDGLTADWGNSSYVNPPFGSIMHQGKKKGATAWARKAIAEAEKGKKVVLVHPIDKWVLMMIKAGAEIRNLGDVKWLATEDKAIGKGTGRHIAAFILNGEKALSAPAPLSSEAVGQLKEIARQARIVYRETSAEGYIQNTTGATELDVLDEMLKEYEALLTPSPSEKERP